MCIGKHSQLPNVECKYVFYNRQSCMNMLAITQQGKRISTHECRVVPKMKEIRVRSEVIYENNMCENRYK